MKRITLILLSLALPSLLLGQEKSKEYSLREINRWEETSIPHTLIQGEKNAQGIAFDPASLLTELPSQRANRKSKKLQAIESGWFCIEKKKNNSAGLLSTYSFTLTNQGYGTGALEVYGKARMALFVDGVCVAQSLKVAEQDTLPSLTTPLKLRPGGHSVYVKTLVLANDTTAADFRVVLKPDSATLASQLSFEEKGQKPLSLQYMMSGKSLYSVRLSPSGKYALVIYRTQRGLQTDYSARIYTSDGKILRESSNLASAQWMPKSDRLYRVRTTAGVRLLVTQKPDGSDEQVLVDPLPKGSFSFSPDERTLYLYDSSEAAPKDKQVQRMTDPDDRMPGWRNRPQWMSLDIASGISVPITYGKEQVQMMDIHPTSGKILFGTTVRDWTKQPYSFTDIYQFDPQTGQTDTLLQRAIDIAEVLYLPKQEGKLLVSASPNSLEGIGKQLPKEQLANSFERELFIFDIATKKSSCLTKDFDPTVEQIRFDYEGNAVIQATKGSHRLLFKVNTKNGQITPLHTTETYVTSYSVASEGKQLWYFGQSATNGDRLYTYRNGKEVLVWDVDAEKMSDYIRPEVRDFTYTTPQGSTIEGWYYLPPHFDAQRKYPMLVYYYGGTIPSERRMEGVYSPAMYAAQGYVVYILNPSGCTGYGQEFAARHLNAWGEPTGTEIIEAIRSFCSKNDFVDSSKIGCFGASYGGFMTQYLLTRSDLFAAAVSHAGISNITNYWGSGYWGMGYSTVASAGSYPWSRKDVYVDQSPLFNADKIHTPLLLLHGDSDTNVPTAESINLYNALKVLGREVELVTFTGEDHFILEPERRIRWTESIFAWFARWLKDDPTWWNELYKQEE